MNTQLFYNFTMFTLELDKILCLFGMHSKLKFPFKAWLHTHYNLCACTLAHLNMHIVVNIAGMFRFVSQLKDIISKWNRNKKSTIMLFISKQVKSSTENKQIISEFSFIFDNKSSNLELQHSS